MAGLPLVVDASVAVKWFSMAGEDDVERAVDILDRQAEGELSLAAPDLLYYELANALAHKRALSVEEVQEAVRHIFALGLRTPPVDGELMALSVNLARRAAITVYDASYAALAGKLKCPLVTANPRHQKQSLGCVVVPLRDWRPPA